MILIHVKSYHMVNFVFLYDSRQENLNIIKHRYNKKLLVVSIIIYVYFGKPSLKMAVSQKVVSANGG